jgi:uncharacterized C2H2 Zn-finger protein
VSYDINNLYVTFHLKAFYFSVRLKMMNRNSKRKLQEEELQTKSKCTKSVGMDPEISAQFANIDEHNERESQEIKNEGKGKCENLQDKSIRFEDFPAEMLLNILNFLEINDLLKSSQTSKRISVICYDDSLWQKVNLSKKKGPTEFPKKVISHGCKSLNLNEAIIVGTFRLKNESQLTNLDLSGCSGMSHVFQELFLSCHYLQKLTFTQSLQFDTLSMLTSQNGNTLQVLNCWWEYQIRDQNIDLQSIQSILENCTELKELNFWNGVFPGNGITYDCGIYHGNVDYLVKNISPNIEKFCVGASDFRDQHIKILVSRCTKIKELRLAGLCITNDSVTHILDHLSPTLEQLELTDNNIDSPKQFQLKMMPKLKILDNLDYKWEIVHELRKQLPNVSVNGYPPMSTVCKKKKLKYDAYFYNGLVLKLCATCNAEFCEKKDLDEHVSNVHDGKNPCKCDLCGSTFARMNELNRHNNNVHGKNTAIHHCQCCNEDFSENLGCKVILPL